MTALTEADRLQRTLPDGWTAIVKRIDTARGPRVVAIVQNADQRGAWKIFAVGQLLELEDAHVQKIVDQMVARVVGGRS